MNDHHISLSELILLIALLGGPALMLGVLLQWWWLRRLGFARQRARTTVLLLSTFGVAFVLTPVVWSLLPEALLQLPIMRGDYPYMVGGVAFLPAVLAVAIATLVLRVSAPRLGARGAA